MSADVPPILYGTAWKEEATAACVGAALAAGYRGIDTAAQRKHYDEASVGVALAAALAAGTVTRAELFVQTKYTFARGHDHRLPYDPAAPIATQVAQSCARSQAQLGLDVIDSYVLHGPWRADDLVAADDEAWDAMEALLDGGHVRALGVSNVTGHQLELLCRRARHRPSYVQNRCYARDGWDAEVRAVAAAHGVRYQGFSLLTANRAVVAGPVVGAIAGRHQLTPAQVVFAFARAMGMLPLTGTRDPAHQADDLAAMAVALAPDEVRAIAAVRG
ncbi:MAG: aldo/keto reductase [Kofleriaceae bacterium]